MNGSPFKVWVGVGEASVLAAGERKPASRHCSFTVTYIEHSIKWQLPSWKGKDHWYHDSPAVLCCRWLDGLGLDGGSPYKLCAPELHLKSAWINTPVTLYMASFHMYTVHVHNNACRNEDCLVTHSEGVVSYVECDLTQDTQLVHCYMKIQMGSSYKANPNLKGSHPVNHAKGKEPLGHLALRTRIGRYIVHVHVLVASYPAHPSSLQRMYMSWGWPASTVPVIAQDSRISNKTYINAVCLQ